MARTEQRRGRIIGLLALVSFGFLTVVVISFAAVLLGWSPFSTETNDRSAPVVLQSLADLSNYEAATGQFSELIDIESDVRLVPDFLAGERTVVVAVGSVDAEVDFSQLTGDNVVVSEDGRSVEIHLPPATLSEPRLDFDETHVASRSRGLANRVGEALTNNAKDDQELYRRAEAQIAEAADATELRDRAEENTRAMLTGLLQGLGFEDVTVSFDAEPAGASL